MHNFHYWTRDSILDLEKFYRRNLINCISGYKSVNLVGTVGSNGKTNLAPFSQIFHIGASPPLMGMIIRPDVVPRHTLENISALGQFTINNIKPEFYEKAHQTSARYQNSEFREVGLEEEYIEGFSAPFVMRSSIKIGLSLEEKTRIRVNGTIMVIGKIEHLFIDKKVVAEDGYVDLEQADSCAGVGLDGYYIGKKLSRLSYAKTDLSLRHI